MKQVRGTINNHTCVVWKTQRADVNMGITSVDRKLSVLLSAPNTDRFGERTKDNEDGFKLVR